MDNKQIASCNCGAVRIKTTGNPTRIGVCHCLTCRKETGSAFMAFAVWNRTAVQIDGETLSWRAATDTRHFCPSCGSRLFATGEDATEIEVRLGGFDEAPGRLTPTYEAFVGRREHWLQPVPGAEYFAGNRI